MKEVEYLVVGLGLAGIAFCEQLRKNNKTFIVYDDESQHSSQIAAGVYNPVVLKRFTAAWNADRQIDALQPFYSELEKLLKIKVNYKLPVLRKFISVEEQNNWFSASDQPFLQTYLSLDLIDSTNSCINASLGYGLVNKTGRIDTSTLIKAYNNYLIDNDQFQSIKFEYDQIAINSEYIIYKELKSKHIVFAEGFGIKNNPFFQDLPLIGNKGEVLIIEAPNLKLNSIIKSSVFMVPIGNNLYYVGATYNRDDKTYIPTEKARQELTKKLDSLINCDYKIIEHKVGIRPTVRDRRPLVGLHHLHKNLAILNGLGTRGVMVGPYVAKQLYEHLENGKSLDLEIDINRFS